MFNRNNNRINRGMRHFEGFDMNRGQGRGQVSLETLDK